MSEARYEVREADSDPASFYYVLVASNGQVLSTSETYRDRTDAERAVKDAKAAADQADEV